MLFNMSIRENIRSARKARPTKRSGGRKRRDPPLHHDCRRNTTLLSASVATRCQAATPAYRDCPRHRPQSSVLLLDEATSALDQTTEAAINKTLAALARAAP
jgi:ATP-binding cassette subfamily B protein